MSAKIYVRIVTVIVLSLLQSSCGHDSPPERENAAVRPSGSGQQTPSEGTGQRPGVNESNDLSHELSDDVWRVSGPDVSLRYDRGGVLFNKKADGATEVLDLDGADRVSVSPGTVGTDSICTGAALAVNGTNIEFRQMKMLSRGDSRTWYVLTDDSDGRWIIVLP